MSFEDNFCPSPWFHARITNNGYFEYCRWADKKRNQRDQTPNIRDISPAEYFHNHLASLRTQMLNGNTVLGCVECHNMEKYGKVSGRQKQLLKIGVLPDQFDKSLASSPWVDIFEQTINNHGKVDLLPVDWQVDLGNYCNSACLFCYPEASSKLANEWVKLGLIPVAPPVAWCNDTKLLQRFLDSIDRTPKLRYLHFIGGETIITPAFKTILQHLVDRKRTNISIGFTTNLTVWDESINNLLVQFEEVNLGLSIECLHPVNDYLRWPSEFNTTREYLSRWVKLAKQHNWLTQMRITPTIFSVLHLDTIYEYAYQFGIAVESCDFLDEPKYMRPTVLPKVEKQNAINNLKLWVNQCQDSESKVINTRNPEFFKRQTVQDAKSYINYLENAPDESHRLPDLIDYIKLMESNRNNSILDYLPEYEEFLRAAGY